MTVFILYSNGLKTHMYSTICQHGFSKNTFFKKQTEVKYNNFRITARIVKKNIDGFLDCEDFCVLFIEHCKYCKLCKLLKIYRD